jgi:hypothetical protein
VRRDCSSRFSPGNRCGTFGAGSVGWVASEEAFFKSIPLLGGANFFKLRASTGVLGDQNIGDLSYVVPIAQNANYVNNGPSGHHGGVGRRDADAGGETPTCAGSATAPPTSASTSGC